MPGALVITRAVEGKRSMHFGFLLFPDVTQLDVAGPAQVFSQLAGSRVHMVWKHLDPVMTDSGFAILPTDDYRSCPQLDVLCVPGGPGQPPLMADGDTRSFLRRQADGAKYVTSVCSGSLLLGAAGLLEGYRATCHRAFIGLLAEFGAEPVRERMVRDRNRFTGGGVAASIDFGLSLAAEMAGERTAMAIQLLLEYDPAPPFDSGAPGKAGPDMVAEQRARLLGAMSAR